MARVLPLRSTTHPTLGDKLQILALQSPVALVSLERLVDWLLTELQKSA